MADLMFFQNRSLSFQRAFFAAALLCTSTFAASNACFALNTADGTSAFSKDKLVGNNDGSISVGEGRHSGSMGNFWHPDNVSLCLADFSITVSAFEVEKKDESFVKQSIGKKRKAAVSELQKAASDTEKPIFVSGSSALQVSATALPADPKENLKKAIGTPSPDPIKSGEAEREAAIAKAFEAQRAAVLSTKQHNDKDDNAAAPLELVVPAEPADAGADSSPLAVGNGPVSDMQNDKAVLNDIEISGDILEKPLGTEQEILYGSSESLLDTAGDGDGEDVSAAEPADAAAVYVGTQPKSVARKVSDKPDSGNKAEGSFRETLGMPEAQPEEAESRLEKSADMLSEHKDVLADTEEKAEVTVGNPKAANGELFVSGTKTEIPSDASEQETLSEVIKDSIGTAALSAEKSSENPLPSDSAASDKSVGKTESMAEGSLKDNNYDASGRNDKENSLGVSTPDTLSSPQENVQAPEAASGTASDFSAYRKARVADVSGFEKPFGSRLLMPDESTGSSAHVRSFDFYVDGKKIGDGGGDGVPQKNEEMVQEIVSLRSEVAELREMLKVLVSEKVKEKAVETASTPNEVHEGPKIVKADEPPKTEEKTK